MTVNFIPLQFLVLKKKISTRYMQFLATGKLMQRDSLEDMFYIYAGDTKTENSELIANIEEWFS